MTPPRVVESLDHCVTTATQLPARGALRGRVESEGFIEAKIDLLEVRAIPKKLE
jgi:hypothetical protein